MTSNWTVRGSLNSDQYTREVLRPIVVSNFDYHPLAARPVFIDENAKPHHSRSVIAFLQGEALTVMSPD